MAAVPAILLLAASILPFENACIPMVDPEEDIQQWLDELDRQTTLAAMVSQMTSPEPTSSSSEAPTTTETTTAETTTTTSGTTTTTTTTGPLMCASGWTENPVNGRCYKFLGGTASFTNAGNLCFSYCIILNGKM